MKLSLTLEGAPRTKKNHGQIVRVGGRPKLLPSAQWRAYEASALQPLHRQATPQLAAVGVTQPLAQPIHLSAVFYRDRASGDLVGYLQGLCDLLEAARIVADDRWITCLDGCRLDKDTARPRVELTLTWGAP